MRLSGNQDKLNLTLSLPPLLPRGSWRELESHSPKSLGGPGIQLLPSRPLGTEEGEAATVVPTAAALFTLSLLLTRPRGSLWPREESKVSLTAQAFEQFRLLATQAGGQVTLAPQGQVNG